MRLWRRKPKQTWWERTLATNPPTINGILNDGPRAGWGYVHEMCAWCFGTGRFNGHGCQGCHERGHLITPVYDPDRLAELEAAHARLGTQLVNPGRPLDTLGHQP